MSDINLSYVITTFNKLSYLRIVLRMLIDARERDEEIVIVDGGSKDGTPEFLQGLFNEGKINKFVSEKDFGEAHGYNKGMLMAEGKLIKLITDDDLFYFPAIRRSKELMLQDPSTDIIFSSGLDYEGLNGTGKVSNYYAEDKANYENWFNKRKAFYACALGIMFRRDSLSLIGLLSTNNVRVDMEYLLRITHNKRVKMQFYDGYSFLRFCNESSNSNKHDKRMVAEGFYLSNYYNSMESDDYNHGLLKYLLKLNWRWLLLLNSRLRLRTLANPPSPIPIRVEELPEIFAKASEILRQENETLEKTLSAKRQ